MVKSFDVTVFGAVMDFLEVHEGLSIGSQIAGNLEGFKVLLFTLRKTSNPVTNISVQEASNRRQVQNWA